MRGTTIVCLGLLALTFSCGSPAEETAQPAEAEPVQVLKATAELAPTEGNSVSGMVTFEAVDSGVKVLAHVTGLQAGKHGFHIHEVGDCSAPDGTSAGGHFNPLGSPHGGPDAEEQHVGDLGNLEAGEDGSGHLDRTFGFLSLEGDHSIVGRAVIVHAGEDDLSTQPTGDAGGRLACAVIEKSQE